MFEIGRDGLPIKRDLENNQTTAPVAKVEGRFRETHECFILLHPAAFLSPFLLQFVIAFRNQKKA